MGKEFVGVRVDTPILEAAKAIAKGEHRSLSNYILTLIAEDIARRESGRGATIQEPPAKYKAAPPKKAQSIRQAMSRLKGEKRAEAEEARKEYIAALKDAGIPLNEEDV